MKLEIDRDRLLSEIEALAAISDADPPAVTRIVFTPTDLKARAWLRKRCEEAGLTLRQDAIGNIFARWDGTDPAAPRSAPVPTSTPFRTPGNTTAWSEFSADWKRYVRCSAVAFVRNTRLSCWFLLPKSRRASASVAWAADCSAGALSAEAAKRLKDSAGESIEDIRRKAGLRGELDNVKLPNGYYKAFVELHIEQGPVLERKQIPLGVVTEHRRSRQHADYDRRRGRTRRRSPDAGSPRRSLRGL